MKKLRRNEIRKGNISKRKKEASFKKQNEASDKVNKHTQTIYRVRQNLQCF